MRTSSLPAGRRWLLAAAAAGSLVLGACSADVTAGSGSLAVGGTGLEAYVRSAAARTATQTSADVTMSMDVQAAGQSIHATGTGQIDFVHRAQTMTITMNVQGMTMTMREVMAGNAMYMSMDMNGQGMKQVFGKDWLKTSLGSAAASSFNQDPLQMLDQLQQSSGVTVRALGRSTINGTAVNGYAVTINNLAAVAGARQRLNALGLSPAQQQKMLDVIQAAGPVHMSIYIDPAKNVLRRTTMDMNMNLGSILGGSVGGATIPSVSATVTLDFDHYGTPVHISVPPASDVTDAPNLGQLLPSH